MNGDPRKIFLETIDMSTNNKKALQSIAELILLVESEEDAGILAHGLLINARNHGDNKWEEGYNEGQEQLICSLKGLLRIKDDTTDVDTDGKILQQTIKEQASDKPARPNRI